MNYFEQYHLEEYAENGALSYFLELCRIPHGSGNEGAVADWLCAFADEKGLFCHRDSYNNVLIVKQGDPDKTSVMLQGHTDMVCEKNADTDFDFETEPLRLVRHGDWLSAEGTTLGADDGVAVAYMMQLLSTDDPNMPTLECLFTTDEERGMTGAFHFDYSLLKSKLLLNLDSEGEGCAWVSCAGGADVAIAYPYDTLPCDITQLDITLSGLAGGHSGADIHRCRGNALILLGQILWELYDKTPFTLCEIVADGKRNAIPRECTFRIATSEAEEAIAYIKEIGSTVKKTLPREDQGMRLRAEKTKVVNRTETALSYRSTSRVLTMLNLIPNGPVTFSPDDLSLVESSFNLANVRTENGEMIFSGLARSSVERRMRELCQRFTVLCRELGMTCTVSGEYPGWAYRKDTPLQQKYLETYQRLFGKEATLEKIHAGLECGLILGAMGDVDCISIGPQIEDIHTPDEKLNLPSFVRCYRLLLALIQE